MKLLLVFGILPLLTFSCRKVETNPKQTCYKGRFVAEGCWPVIQVLDPLSKSIPTVQYGAYEHTIGTGSIPERYKNGQPFYFIISHIDSNKIYLTYCSPTKYLVEISNFSDSACAHIVK